MVVDRVIALASPRAALRRSIRLSAKGRAVEAFSLLARAAKAGIADAEYRVARCYLDGSGVPPSRLEGGRWLQRAATHECVEAQVLLSALCIRGLVSITSRPAGWGENGTKRLFASDAPADPDFECAEKWARRAAQAGSAEGQALLAYVLTFGPEWMRDLEEAHRWYERSAAGACPQGHLGYALALARRASDESIRRQIAIELRRAADAELPTAMYLLAVITEKGIGVECDCKHAMQLYRRAAEKGHRGAQLRWGIALVEGRDVEQDLVTGEVMAAPGCPWR